MLSNNKRAVLHKNFKNTIQLFYNKIGKQKKANKQTKIGFPTPRVFKSKGCYGDLWNILENFTNEGKFIIYFLKLKTKQKQWSIFDSFSCTVLTFSICRSMKCLSFTEKVISINVISVHFFFFLHPHKQIFMQTHTHIHKYGEAQSLQLNIDPKKSTRLMLIKQIG